LGLIAFLLPLLPIVLRAFYTTILAIMN